MITSITPENDLADHIENCVMCECGPIIIKDFKGTTISHRAYDFRDIMEKLEESDTEFEGEDSLIRAIRNSIGEDIRSSYFAGAYNALSLILNLIVGQKHGTGFINADNLDGEEEYNNFCKECLKNSINKDCE